VPDRRKRATIREVAQATGLSPAAVSYALRGIQTSEETQERVRAAAEELGYEAHPIARALASGRTGMVGLLCGSLEDYWQQSLAVGIGRALLAKDRYALLVDAGSDPARELSLARQLRDQRVDGLIVQSLDPSAELWAELAETVPVVSIGDALRGGHSQGEVVFDNRQGVTLALEHLHGLGHRRIAVLTPSRPSTPDRPAERVVADVCRSLDMEATVVNSRHSIEDAERAAAELLGSEPRPTALFCLSDSIACGVYAAASAQELEVPSDLSVAGYDGHPIAGVVTPPLTTVEWGMADVATAAAGLLAAAVAGRPKSRTRVRVAPELVTRASTAVPARAKATAG
jgi:DNA-binding LacI/PurR family transcriptional regulator